MKRITRLKFLVTLFVLISYFAIMGTKGLNLDEVLHLLDEKERTEVFLKQDGGFDFRFIEPYNGKPYIEVNGNKPFFKEEEITTKEFERYSELDKLGRCGTAYACVGKRIMPKKKRRSISHVRPTGWSLKSKNASGKMLYNRCHLIAHQLTGEDDNERNLITGTRYFNIEGMLPLEELVADYVKATGNHVLYRVTPVFVGKNLMACGVLMEGYSVEDEGEGVNFCAFAYNVQPGVEIDYVTGESRVIKKKK